MMLGEARKIALRENLPSNIPTHSYVAVPPSLDPTIAAAGISGIGELGVKWPWLKISITLLVML